MDIGTPSFKWRNLALSGTAIIDGALTAGSSSTTNTLSGYTKIEGDGLCIHRNTSGADPYIVMQDEGTTIGYMYAMKNTNSRNSFEFRNLAQDKKPLLIDFTNNRLGVGGVSSPTYTLDVNGTGYFSGTVTIGSYTLPTADGTAGYHLQTDGAGAVTWQPGGSGTVTGTGTANYISKWTGTSSQGNSIIQDNGTTVTVGGALKVVDATVSYSSGQNRLEVDKDLKLERSSGTSIYMRRTTADTVSLLGKIEFGNNNIDSNVAVISAYQGGATDAGELRFETEATGGSLATRMIIKSDGKVGIGTTNPGSFQTWINAPAYFDDVVWTANAGGLGSYDTGGTLKSILILNSSDELVVNHNAGGTIPTRVKGDYITFEPSDSVLNAPIETMRIVGGIGVGAKGCVGIGTDAPLTPLHVKGSTGNPSTSANNGVFTLNSSNAVQLQFGSYAATPYGYWLQTKDNNNAGPYNYPLLLQPVNGNVGIGLANPDGRLEIAITPTVAATTVNETDDFADKFVISNAATSNFGDRIPLVFNVGGKGADNISAVIVGEREASGWRSALSFWVNNVTSGSESTDAIQEAMRINSDGNVGIGTTAPGSYKLRVQGDVYISGTLTEASSLAIKENIETYSPSLEKINKMRPVRFNKKKSKKKEVGLVAEELAEMFPELVETDEKGNAVGVNYSRAVAVLLHGFKELYKEVKELKEKI